VSSYPITRLVRPSSVQAWPYRIAASRRRAPGYRPTRNLIGMSWTSRAAIFAALILALAVAACSGSITTTPPLKFSTVPSAVVHAGATSDVPIRASDPGATISESGPMPSGMSFRRGPSGSAAIVGVPGGDSGGYYQVRLTAVDGSQRASQEFTLSVDERPYFPSIDNTTFGANEYHGNQDVIVATGYPMPQLSYTGTLPDGFTIRQTGIGVLTISGSPGSFETPCSSQITVQAVSSSGAATLPVTIKIGDWLCFYNVAGPWVSQFGSPIIGEAGKWLWRNGKKVAAWVWQRGRTVIRSPQAEQAAEDAATAA
jgi:hypothetical protein